MVEQLHAARIQYRKEAEVKLAAIHLCRLIANSVNLEALTRPFASISIARHGRAVIRLQRARKLSNGRLWTERSFALKQAIENNSPFLNVRYRQRHGVA